MSIFLFVFIIYIYPYTNTNTPSYIVQLKINKETTYLLSARISWAPVKTASVNIREGRNVFDCIICESIISATVDIEISDNVSFMQPVLRCWVHGTYCTGYITPYI